MSRRRALTLLFLSGCAQEHLSIGAVKEPDAEVIPDMPQVDAGTKPAIRDSATAVVDAGGLLSASLRAFDLDDVTTIGGSCGNGCIDVEMVAQGGTPPYRFTWFDGYVGPRRRACDRDGIEWGFPVGTVVDASDAGTQFVVASLYISPCDDASVPTDVGPWFVCYRPKQVTFDCGVRDVFFEVGHTLSADAYAQVSFAVTGIIPATMGAAFSNDPCGERESITTAPIWALSATSLSASVLQGMQPRYLRVFSVDNALGEFPAWISIGNVELCVSR